MWRFVVQFRDWPSQTIDVADHDLVAGQVVVGGRAVPVSEKAFFDDTCGYAPTPPSKTFIVALGVILALGLATALLVARRSPKRSTKRRCRSGQELTMRWYSSSASGSMSTGPEPAQCRS